jgi:cellulose synthase operon protein C
MKRTLDLTFIGSVLGITFAMGVGIYFLHDFQVTRNVVAFRDRANRAREAGNLIQTADYLRRYLVLRPHDAEALSEYGLLLEAQAKSLDEVQRAYLVLDQVLRLDPGRAEVRRRLVHIAMTLHRFGDAVDFLKTLRHTPPDDAELEELHGQCQLSLGEYRHARASFERAIALAPGQIDSYALLATLLRQQPNEVTSRGENQPKLMKLAEDTMDRLIERNKKSFRAYVARARYRQQFAPSGDSIVLLRAAEQDLEEARHLAPDEAEVLLGGGELALNRRDFPRARDYLKRGCEKHPKDARMCQLLATVEVQDRKFDQAVACLKEGLERLPNHATLRWELADALIRAGKTEEAKDVVDALRKDRFPPVMLDFMQARIHIVQKEWRTAARLLEDAYPLLTEDRALAEQVGLLLGQCYDMLGDLDRAQAAYYRVVALAPRSVPARLGLARVFVTLGQIPEALDQYEQITRLPDAPDNTWTEIARLRILRNLQRDTPDWTEVDAALTRAEGALPSTAVVILRAESLAARKEYARARAELERVPDDEKKPRPIEVWVAMAVLEERRGSRGAVLPLLEMAEKKLGDSVELRLARAQHWATEKGPTARDALSRLSENTTRFTEEDCHRLVRGLASAYSRVGDSAKSRELWSQLALQRPDDLGIRLAQFDLALRAGEEAAVEQVLDDMRRIEGPEGTLWRYSKVCQLIARAGKTGDSSPLEQARSLLTFVSARRPRWSRVQLCAAQIDDLSRNLDAALTNYLGAIQLGDRNPLAIRRAAELLTARGRHAEANAIIKKLPEHTPLSGDLQRVVAEVMLRAGDDRDQALSLAEKAVAADSRDYREYIWLGRMLLASGQVEQAEKVEAMFRKAVTLADTEPAAWLTLIQYLALMKKTKEAEAEVEIARAKLTGDRALLVLAQCHEVVGHKKEAETLYQSALKANPNEVTTLQAVVGFCMRSGDFASAEKHLRNLILVEKDPRGRAVASRQLAIVLSVRGGYQESREALELVGVLLDEGLRPQQDRGGTVEEKRTRATLLAAQATRRERQQAIPILEGMLTQNQATPEDQFLLAQLYEIDGAWPKANRRLQALVGLPSGDNPRRIAHRAYYTSLLLEHGQMEDAQASFEKLAEQEPESLRTKTLKARLLKAQGKDREAVALLRSLATGKEPNVLLGIAGVLEGMKENEPAESVYRDYVKAASETRPESALVLAQFLGRHRRVREALDVCESARERSNPLAVMQICLLALSVGSVDDAQAARVEGWLMAEIEKTPDSSNLQSALAHVKLLRGRYDEAEAVYRKAAEKNNRDMMAVNNLAYLLALRGGKGEEALQLVERAVQVGGPRPNYLDTRAVAALSLGRSEPAIRDLTEVIREAPSAIAYFHLALAQQMAKNTTGARTALKMAQARGLKAAELHPLERAPYEELVRKLGVSGNPAVGMSTTP